MVIEALKERQVIPYKSKIFKNKSIFDRVEQSSTEPTIDDPPSSNLNFNPSLMKNPTMPLDMDNLLDFGIMTSPKECSTSTETNSYTEPSSIGQLIISGLSDHDSSELNLTNTIEEEMESVSTAEMLSMACPVIVTSVSYPINIVSSVSSASNILPSVSSSVIITSSASSSVTVTPSVLNSITVISSLPSPMKVISSVPSHITVSSTMSNVSSSEVLNADNILVSKHLTVLKDCMSTDSNLKPVNIHSKIEYLKHLKTNINPAKNFFDNEKLPTLIDVTKTTRGTLFSQSLSSQSCIPVIKHTHQHGICINGPKTSHINKEMPQIAVFKKSKY